MKLREIARLAVAVIVAAFAFDCIGAALAQDAAVAAAPEMTWLDFAKGLGLVIFGYLKAPAVLAFLMSHARAWFPALGNLGILTVVGDVIAGNYGAAKNAG